jgi:hypothetical protein
VGPGELTVGGVLSDALALYRALWRRAIVVAGLVFVVVGLADALAARSGTDLTRLVDLVLGLIGSVLVQGALVQVVRDIREGLPAVPVATLFDRSRARLGTLLGTSVLYALGVVFGALLLLVPGLIALARWSLVAPLVMIEHRGWNEAFERSSELVRGRTGRVLVLVLVTMLSTFVLSLAIAAAFRFLPEFAGIWIGDALAGAVTAPYEAFVLTVLYYRLSDPGPPAPPA